MFCLPWVLLGALAQVSAVEPVTVVLMNVESLDSAVVSLRLVGTEPRRISLKPKARRAVVVRPGARLEYYGSEGWQPVEPGAHAQVEFQITRRPGRSPSWSLRRYERKVLWNNVGMKLVPIPAGRFAMGSQRQPQVIAGMFSTPNHREDAEPLFDEYPRHTVTITKPFYISAHEVTSGQFQVFVGDAKYTTDAERDGLGGGTANPQQAVLEGALAGETWMSATGQWRQHAREEKLKGMAEDVPVTLVSWNDAMKFCEWLSQWGQPHVYRLPTEAEWEYACRAGTTTLFNAGDDVRDLRYGANLPDQAREDCFGRLDYPILPSNDGYCGLAPVGSYPPNAFGLFDMHGNVWEWCLDTYDAMYYRRSPQNDPVSTLRTSDRVMRGGCFL